MKSDIEIKDDIYAVLKNSALVAEAGGALRKSSKRPANSDKEDITISVLTNQDFGTEQVAVVYVRVYVPAIMRDGQLEVNDPRCRQLAKLCNEVLSVYNGGDFRFVLRSQLTTEAEGGNAYVIANRCEYTQNND